MEMPLRKPIHIPRCRLASGQKRGVYVSLIDRSHNLSGGDINNLKLARSTLP